MCVAISSWRAESSASHSKFRDISRRVRGKDKVWCAWQSVRDGFAETFEVISAVADLKIKAVAVHLGLFKFCGRSESVQTPPSSFVRPVDADSDSELSAK